MLDAIEVLWPIFVAIAGFVVFKVIPYAQTKIFRYKHYNIEMSFVLMEYELLGSMISHLIVMLSIIIFGKSTWQELQTGEYVIAWGIVTFFYLLLICLIIKRKKQKGKPKYIKNMALGFLVHGGLSLQLGMILEEVYDESTDAFFYAWVIGMLIVQFLANHVEDKVKNIEYKVYTDKESYDSKREPVKRGKYYFIKTQDEEGREWIQIPEDKIRMIEYYVENITKEKADS